MAYSDTTISSVISHHTRIRPEGGSSEPNEPPGSATTTLRVGGGVWGLGQMTLRYRIAQINKAVPDGVNVSVFFDIAPFSIYLNFFSDFFWVSDVVIRADPKLPHF